MAAVTITVDSTESFKQRVKAAFAGKQQQERISFESFDPALEGARSQPHGACADIDRCRAGDVA
jgi:hypothetical protein